MVLKGCTKRVIVVRDTGSDLFEEAIFFLKPEKTGAGKVRTDHDFAAEANRLIFQKSGSGRQNAAIFCAGTGIRPRQGSAGSRKREIKIFFSGAAIAAVASLLLSFLIF